MTHGRDPMLPRGTDKCMCPTCGLYFNSSYAFGLHRTGPWEARTCLTVETMRARGWAQTKTGHWITGHRPAAAPRRDDDDSP
ncbi:MAG TPA: hypothetical protein VF764_12510 [Steroidobacteraceae bacterium]